MIMQMENIYLTGFMGAGKSTVGRHLAALLSYDFFEIDAELVKIFRTPLAFYIKQEGMKVFKEKEAMVLSALSARNKAVIATNAGTLTTREAVGLARKTGKIIFINTPFYQCHRKIDGDIAKPFSYGRSRTELQELFHSRFKIYSSTADFAVNGLNSAQQIAAEIKTWLTTLKYNN